jgi:hypothetical protein
VVVEQGSPGLRGRMVAAPQVLAPAGLGDLAAQLAPLAGSPRSAPEWVLAAPDPKPRAHLPGNAGAARFTVSDVPVPNRRKPVRCQPIPVAALTMKTLDCQSSQTALSQAQSKRSAGVSFGSLDGALQNAQ